MEWIPISTLSTPNSTQQQCTFHTQPRNPIPRAQRPVHDIVKTCNRPNAFVFFWFVPRWGVGLTTMSSELVGKPFFDLGGDLDDAIQHVKGYVDKDDVWNFSMVGMMVVFLLLSIFILVSCARRAKGACQHRL